MGPLAAWWAGSAGRCKICRPDKGYHAAPQVKPQSRFVRAHQTRPTLGAWSPSLRSHIPPTRDAKLAPTPRAPARTTTRWWAPPVASQAKPCRIRDPRSSTLFA
ncbi:hypothetical protein Lesp02_28020 [Lentzea sp. NBRC 105346]|nr:hypothetical protein Lesp02_28020 [Lentzea sp. NBRC 105346]